VKINIDTKARLAFAAVLLITIFGGAAWYLHSRSHFATYRIYTRDSVSGLIVDAPIEFHGVEVGKVKEIRLVDPRLVDIVLSIDKSAPVTTASVATITSRGLATRGFTGYVYVSLDDVGDESRPLTAKAGAPYPVIRVAPSKVITLDTDISQVRDNVQVITALLQSLLDRKTILSLQQSAESMQRLTKLMSDNSQKFNSIIDHAEVASRRFDPLLKSSQEMVTALQTQVLPEVHVALTTLEPLLESSQDTVRALQMQVLPEAHQALIGLDKLSTELNGVATRISQDPSIVIRGTTPPPLGPGESK
jgi:phospholipid/cholesterol/gamma-HCH transport system substrate-binding protein